MEGGEENLERRSDSCCIEIKIEIFRFSLCQGMGFNNNEKKHLWYFDKDLSRRIVRDGYGGGGLGNGENF